MSDAFTKQLSQGIPDSIPPKADIQEGPFLERYSPREHREIPGRGVQFQCRERGLENRLPSPLILQEVSL